MLTRVNTVRERLIDGPWILPCIWRPPRKGGVQVRSCTALWLGSADIWDTTGLSLVSRYRTKPVSGFTKRSDSSPSGSIGESVSSWANGMTSGGGVWICYRKKPYRASRGRLQTSSVRGNWERFWANRGPNLVGPRTYWWGEAPERARHFHRRKRRTPVT